MENIKAGGKFSECHVIEFMACPGGCLGGGGQPIPTNPEMRAEEPKPYMMRMNRWKSENLMRILMFYKFIMNF